MGNSLIRKKFSGAGLLMAAAVILFAFAAVHWCGFREFTNILSGTGAYQPEQQLRALAYITLYLASVVAAPILLIIFVIRNCLFFIKRRA